MDGRPAEFPIILVGGRLIYLIALVLVLVPPTPPCLYVWGPLSNFGRRPPLFRKPLCLAVCPLIVQYTKRLLLPCCGASALAQKWRVGK